MNIVTPSFGLLHFYTACFEKRSKPLSHTHTRTHAVTARGHLHSGCKGTPEHLPPDLSSQKPCSINVFLPLPEDDDVFFQAMNRRALFFCVLTAPVATEELLGRTVTQERSEGTFHVRDVMFP